MYMKNHSHNARQFDDPSHPLAECAVRIPSASAFMFRSQSAITCVTARLADTTQEKDMALVTLIRGTELDDHLVGTPGRDYIQGLGGNDWIAGGASADNLEGNQGDDTLSGGAGDDILFGDQGNDVLFGNDGNDDFMFTSGNGKDAVMDFTVGDRLHIEAGINHTGIHTLADLADRVEADGSGSTVVDLGEGNSITLSNVNATDVQHHPEQYFSII
jgi:Ca2+-binding RTX toxin-like protein